MRGLLLITLAACASEQPQPSFNKPGCPPIVSNGDSFACNASWGLGSGAVCETPCVLPPAYDGPACDACRPYVGERACERTFTWHGYRGCCDLDNNAVRFLRCE